MGACCPGGPAPSRCPAWPTPPTGPCWRAACPSCGESPTADCQTSTRLVRVSDGTLIADLGTALSRRPRFSPDGKHLVAGALVMDLATRATVALPTDAALSVYLPDGRIAVAERS